MAKLNRIEMAGLLAGGVPIYHPDLAATFELSMSIQKECTRIQHQMRSIREMLVQRRLGSGPRNPSSA
jgi:hypothetical protein